MAKKKKDDGAKKAGIIVLAAGVGVGLYYLLRSPSEAPKAAPTAGPTTGPPSVTLPGGVTLPGQTQAGDLPPLELPLDFPTLGSVATAYDILKTNWTMGRIEPPEAWDSTVDLISAVNALRLAGVGDEPSAQIILGNLASLQDDINDYVQLTDVA